MFLEAVGDVAKQVGGGILDRVKGVGADISKFVADPGASIKNAWQNSAGGQMMQDPKAYMIARIQAVLAGKVPPNEDDLKMIQAMRQIPAGAQMPMGGLIGQAPGGSQPPTGGFINQNPQFLNSAQQGIVR
jgi:hypothetical protein